MIRSSPRYASPDRHDVEDAPVERAKAESPGFDRLSWDESRAEGDVGKSGGRAVLGGGLLLLAILWLGYTAWSAGRALASEPLSSPQIAQWVAIAAGPLALLGLVWLMFGRTRRKEAERFTRSVVAMRTEARSLEGLLEVLSQRISDSRSELNLVAESLMRLGDETTARIGSVTGELGAGSDRLAQQARLFDRAAEAARTDLAVILDDLPKAEQHARNIAEQLRASGADTAGRTAEFAAQVDALSDRTREADEIVAAASQRLVGHLTHIESAGAAAAARVSEAEAGFSTAIDALLDRTSVTLQEIRAGIDAQASAVSALVEQASAGIGQAGVESSQALGANVESANAALEALSSRVAEQERSSLRITAEIDRALGELEQRFASLAQTGDERAERFTQALGRSRAQLESFAEAAGGQDQAIAALAERTESLRGGIDQLAASLRNDLGGAVEQSELLARSAEALRPEIEWIREAAGEASGRIEASALGIAEQQDRFAALLASLDDGVGTAEERLVVLSTAISRAQSDAQTLSAETGPALVQAMVQVREAAAHAAQRAREAIAGIIPESAQSLSQATREALEQVIRESVQERLAEVESIAARAVESARSATERLTSQMLTLGQSATALEQHVERQQSSERQRATEEFARRVSLLIDSMHSASIDVGKILSDEFDEKAWESYLKGNRGVFTRRAVRLLDGSETRAIRSHFESDVEFAQSVSRYIHDFEAMLRRVMAERDGGMIAVTLMSSDMGKLYAALSEAIERKR